VANTGQPESGLYQSDGTVLCGPFVRWAASTLMSLDRRSAFLNDIMVSTLNRFVDLEAVKCIQLEATPHLRTPDCLVS
jgi:hypothetical protein